MRNIGAHVSTSGGFEKALERGRDIDADVIQIFGASPVQWRAKLPTEQEGKSFIEKAKTLGIKKVFLHAPYLINLTSPKEELRLLSKNLLMRHAEIAHMLGTEGVIFHIGSRGTIEKKEAENIVIQALKEIFQHLPYARLYIENTAGAGNLVGDTIDEISHIIDGVGEKNLNVCIDTAHAFESGIVEYTKEGVDVFVKEFEKKIGVKKLKVIHCNDSKTQAGSRKDRHENIGDGYITAKNLGLFLNHEKIQEVPIILEVPGLKGEGPDLENIKRIKKIIKNT